MMKMKKKQEESVNEGMNCGCGKDPCETFGKNNEKLTVYIGEELENYLEESLYYGLIEEDDELLEKKKKKKLASHLRVKNLLEE